MTKERSGNGDKVRRAFERISSIRQNIPEDHVDERFVQEYSDALHHLHDAGYNVKEFEIPQQWLELRVVRKSDIGIAHAKYRSVDRALFLTKVDAVLGYFTRSREKIGFTVSNL
jgi:hypothetical protein